MARETQHGIAVHDDPAYADPQTQRGQYTYPLKSDSLFESFSGSTKAVTPWVDVLGRICGTQ